MALSGDGNTVLVGGWRDNIGAGAVWVYTRSGGVWTQQGSKLAGTGAVGTAEQGNSVALSADGNTAIVGGSGDNGGAGATWVYTRSGGVWTSWDIVDSQLPTTLGGTSVLVNGKNAYMVYVSPGQINFLEPAGSSHGNVPVQVITSNGASNPLSVPGSA